MTNLVQLIGLGIAIDYSLLIVYRFREELERGRTADDAVVRTMQTAGRAVIFSGATVAIGLALLLFMPIPFIRSIGVGGFLIPLVSVAAAATLQPALLVALRPARDRRAPVAPWLRAAAACRRPATRTSTAASGRGSRARSCAGRCRTSSSAARSSSGARCRRSACS